jgi:hypothetical protein
LSRYWCVGCIDLHILFRIGSQTRGTGAVLRCVWLHPKPRSASRDTCAESLFPYHDDRPKQVSQLYLSHPKGALEPPSILKGFQRVLLNPGQSAIVRHNLTRYDLSVWNSVQQGWSRPQGTIGIMIGASSRDFRLRDSIPELDVFRV